MSSLFTRFYTSNNNIRHWLLFIAIVVLGLLTLKTSPLPWYDEVDFASITHSYVNNKTFTCEANDLYFPVKGREVLYYGPVYFVLNGMVAQWFGFGILQLRILNFLAGVVCIYLFIKLFARLTGKPCTSESKIIIALLMMSDYTYMQNMHSGRMDLLALLFVLVGLLLADISSRRLWLNFFLSGFFIAVALLTTPRVYFIVLPYYGWLLYTYFKSRQLYILGYIIYAGCSACFFYLLWVFLKFGSISGFIGYFTTPTTYFSSAASVFFTSYTGMPGYQMIYFILLLVLIAFIAVKKYKRLFSPANIVSLATIILFLALSGGSIIYMGLITGFIYFLLTGLAGELGKGKYLVAGLLLVLNFGLAGYKYFIIIDNYNDRNPQALNAWMDKSVRQGSKVVADDKYYYAVIKGGSQFQYLFRGGTDAERAVYHNEQWKADYLLTGDTGTTVFGEYRKHARLALLDEYRPSAGSVEHVQDVTGSYHGFLFRFLR